MKRVIGDLFGEDHVEFVEEEEAIVGIAKTEFGLDDPRMCQLVDTLLEIITPGAVLSVHWRPAVAIFIVGANRRHVARLERRYVGRKAA